MQIKQFTSFSLTFKEHFIEFCERSKPMDFCQISSRKLRRERILQYLKEWSNGTMIYEAHKNGTLVFGAVFAESDSETELLFGFGNFNSFYHHEIAEAWYEILSVVFKNSAHQLITSPLRRKYKRKSFLKWIQKYDKMCKIKKVNGQLIATWNRNDWSN